MQAGIEPRRETALDLVLTAIGFVAAFVPIIGLLLAPLGVVSLVVWFRVAALPDEWRAPRLLLHQRGIPHREHG